MTTRLLRLATAAFLLALSAGANAQQSPASPQIPAQAQQQQSSQGGITGPGMAGRGMMGEGMMGPGMMREGMMGRGMMGSRMMGPMMSPLAMRMIFALMDGDGDGTVSLQEFQTAHERIFKAMDANKDGVLTPEEIQSFMRGTSTPVQQPSNRATPQQP